LGGWSLAQNPHTRELLANPAIINREDLPRVTDTTGKPK